MPIVKEIIVCKANGLQGETIPDVKINIIEDLPDLNLEDDKELNKFYTTQAESIVRALFASLPAATVDRILYVIMRDKLSLYRGLTKR